MALQRERSDPFDGFLEWHAEPNAIGQLVKRQPLLAIDTTKPLTIIVDRPPCGTCLDPTDATNVSGQILKGAEALGIKEVRINYLLPGGTPNSMDIILKLMSNGWSIIP